MANKHKSDQNNKGKHKTKKTPKGNTQCINVDISILGTRLGGITFLGMKE